MKMVCRPAFNYARDPHEVTLTNIGAVFAIKVAVD